MAPRCEQSRRQGIDHDGVAGRDRRPFEGQKEESPVVAQRPTGGGAPLLLRERCFVLDVQALLEGAARVQRVAPEKDERVP